MNALLERLHDSYMERTASLELQKRLWGEVADAFPPRPAGKGAGRPSVEIARIGGDMGVSLLWIVQASLVRTMIREFEPPNPEPSGRIAIRSIGALAHSEKNDPVIISPSGSGYRLTGRKNYITGGRTADYLLLTCREAGEDKVSRLVFLPADRLTPNALAPLDLKSLRTTDHASLSLDAFPVSETDILDADPAALRRSLKTWGLIERALIIEAFLAYLIYLEGRLENTSETGALEQALEVQGKRADAGISAALAGDRIAEELPDYGLILKSVQSLKSRMSSLKDMPEDLILRLSDIDFLASLKS